MTVTTTVNIRLDQTLRVIKITPVKEYNRRTRKGINTTYISQEPVYAFTSLNPVSLRYTRLTAEEFMELRLKSKQTIMIVDERNEVI